MNRVAYSLEEAKRRADDEQHLRAVGSSYGAALPHPNGCGCSEHVDPCPHDIRHYMRGFFDLCARCGSDWPKTETA